MDSIISLKFRREPLHIGFVYEKSRRFRAGPYVPEGNSLRYYPRC
jgi:hypothetical protein